MTTTIYVASTQAFSGKSAVCVGLLRRFRRDGWSVGYMKPVSTMARLTGGRAIDEDAHFVKYTLGLEDSPEVMAPVLLTEPEVTSLLSGDNLDAVARVRSAYDTIARNRDIVVVEGGSTLREGRIVGLSPAAVIDLLDAAPLALVPYQDDLQVIDDLLAARELLGRPLIGAIINQVPEERIDPFYDEIQPLAERQGVPILGVLPRKMSLLSTNVAELCDSLGGEILCCHYAIGAKVEHLMVGAMDVDLALSYFRQVTDKAVITTGDRSDIQLAALETSTRCLILTNNLPPADFIVERAKALGVPIISTEYDTVTTIEIIESFFGKHRFHQEEKVKLFDMLMVEHVDFKALYHALAIRR